MTIIFNSIVRKYNERGVGFIYLPDKHQNKFKIGQQLKITIELPNNKIIFFAKLRKTHKAGVYVPAHLSEENNLFDQATIIIEEIDGFFTKISEDGRIYLPQNYAQAYGIKEDEIALVEGIVDEKYYQRFVQIKIRAKEKTTEYFCIFSIKLQGNEGIFQIKSMVSRNKIDTLGFIQELIRDFNYAPLEDNKVVMFYGNRVPIIIKTNFILENVAHYLGCYFSDGTKKGNSWGICASTSEQAKYFLRIHKSLIENAPLKYELTYTDPFNEVEETLREKLSAYWLHGAIIPVPKEKIWIYKTETKDAQNRNKYGAFSMREHRQLTLVYYNKLLDYLLNKIVDQKDKNLALEFICGVLEGDGAPSAKARGHVVIATNREEAKLLLKVFNVLGFKHKGYDEEENRWYLRIGSLELIKNMPFLHKKIFQYYPKRRKRLQERLANTGAAKFLMLGTKTSNSLIRKLKDEGILDQKRNLTEYGKKVKESLQEFFKQP